MKAFLLLLLLTGCAGQIVSMDCERMTTLKTVTFTWVPTVDPVAECKARGAETITHGGCITCIEGLGYQQCTVFMEQPQDVPDAVAGHEFRHPFGCKHA